MKEIIVDRLRKVESLEQRQVLKEIVNGVFMNLIEYQEGMNRKLEERIFNEIENEEAQYDVYVTVCSKDDIDLLPEYLYPMVASDLEPLTITSKKLRELVNNKEPVTLFTLFLQADSFEIEALLTHERNFNGRLQTTDGHYEITVHLQQHKTYIQEIENVYHAFQMNGIPWKTIYHPYAYKFFDVVLTDCPALKEAEEIVGFTIDFEEFEDKKQLDKIPLWNIEKLALKSIGFPIPALDKVNYEHMLSIRKTGTEHGYLVATDEDSVRYIKRSENELTVVSSRENSGIWNLLKVTKVEREKVNSVADELVSNRRTDRFINKYGQQKALSVKTMGEIIRIVNSFEVAISMELVDIAIKENFQDAKISYAANPFISGEIDMKSDKKVMVLQFKALQEQDFMANDRMSFLVSEVQRHFSEYRCEGAWV